MSLTNGNGIQAAPRPAWAGRLNLLTVDLYERVRAASVNPALPDLDRRLAGVWADDMRDLADSYFAGAIIQHGPGDERDRVP